MGVAARESGDEKKRCQYETEDSESVSSSESSSSPCRIQLFDQHQNTS